MVTLAAVVLSSKVHYEETIYDYEFNLECFYHKKNQFEISWMNYVLTTIYQIVDLTGFLLFSQYSNIWWKTDWFNSKFNSNWAFTPFNLSRTLPLTRINKTISTFQCPLRILRRMVASISGGYLETRRFKIIRLSV